MLERSSSVVILLFWSVFAFNQSTLLDSAVFYLRPIEGKVVKNGSFILRTASALYFTTYDKLIKQQYDSIVIADLKSYFIYDTLLLVNTTSKLKIFSINNRKLLSEINCERLDRYSNVYPSVSHVYNNTIILNDSRLINIQDLTKPFYENYTLQVKKLSTTMRIFHKNLLFDLEYYDAEYYGDYNSSHEGEVIIWDISQLQSPKKVSSFCIINCPDEKWKLKISPTAFVVNDSLLFITGIKNSLRIFDIRDLTKPKLLESYRRYYGVGNDDCHSLVLINNRLLSMCNNAYFLYRYDSTLYKGVESNPWKPENIDVQMINSSIPLGYNSYKTLTAQKDYFLLIDEWFVYEFNLFKQKWYCYRFK